MPEMKKIKLLLAAIAIAGLGIVEAPAPAQAQQQNQAAPPFISQPIDSKAQRLRDAKAFVGAANSLQYVIEQMERRYNIKLQITDIKNWRVGCGNGGNCAWLCEVLADVVACTCHSAQDGCGCSC
jgi:hypothetical protein